MHRKNLWHECLYILLITLLFFIFYGYTINTGDQEEHLPQIYKQLDPSLYTHDFFVNEFVKREHTIRDFYILFVGALSKIFPLAAVLFGLTFISIFLTVYSFFYITKLFSASSLAPYLSVIIIFFFTLKFPVGGNHLQYSQLMCSTLAKGLASLALLHFFRQKYDLVFILLGIATLFQLLVGLQLFIVILLYCCIVNHITILAIARSVLLYLITAGYILLPVVYHYFTHTSIDNSSFYHLLFDIRNPEHYHIEATPLLHLVVFLFFYVLGVIVLWRSNINHKKTVIFMIVTITIFCIVQFICIEVETLRFLVPAQWYKTTIWMVALLSCVIAIRLTVNRRPDNRLKVLGFRLKSIFSTFNFQLSILIVLVAFVLFNSKSIPIKGIRGRYQIGNYQRSDLTLIHEWIRDHTPKDAVIISFPSDNSLLCEAKRSMPIEFRAMIHDNEYMNNWIKEVNQIYRIESLPSDIPFIEYLEGLYNTDDRIPYSSSVNVDYKLVDITKYKIPIPDRAVIHKQNSYWLLAVSY